MDEKQRNEERYQLVVKSNELIRKSRFNLSVQEQRIILYLISKIKPEDESVDTYEFHLKDFCEVCGLEYKQNISSLKDTIKGIRDKSIWIKLPSGMETTLSWIEKPYIDFNSGLIRIRLDRDMLPYLCQLKGQFTQYELIATLALKSKYSLRLFELFQSYKFEGIYRVSLGELKKSLFIEENEYTRFVDFRKYVIDKAINEIELYTKLEVGYRTVKKGRKVDAFIFTIWEESLDNEYIQTRMYLDGKMPSTAERLQQEREALKKVKEFQQQQEIRFDALKRDAMQQLREYEMKREAVIKDLIKHS